MIAALSAAVLSAAVLSAAALSAGLAVPMVQSQAVAQHSPLEMLPPAAIRYRLQALPEWQLTGNQLTTTCEFEDFVSAIAFINRLVGPAEQLAHHPDIQLTYNRLTLILTTQDANQGAGGLTELDMALATTISQLIAQDQRGTCRPS